MCVHVTDREWCVCVCVCICVYMDMGGCFNACLFMHAGVRVCVWVCVCVGGLCVCLFG